MDFTAVWNQSVVLPLMVALKWFADLTHSGGLAIIAMTILIKTVLLPLSIKQTNSMKAMQAIQPEIAALKKKTKDREKLTQETMRLYKERGINPAAGCLPMIPMMVVLIGLYGALINLAQCDEGRDLAIACDTRFQEPFLWLERLDQPDAIFVAFLGFGLPGILPIAMAITQYFSSKMMTMPTQDPQQQSINRMMTIMMPGMMLFWGVTFPAGLVLYWFVSNVYEMVRLYFTMGPQSLGGIGSFKFGSAAKEAEPVDGGDGTRPADQTQSETSDSGPRANGRPPRPRQKRGKRSGRR